MRHNLKDSAATLPVYVPSQAPKGFERLSANRKDSGFAAYEKIRGNGLKCDILLNGVRISDVVTADATKGFVNRFARDANGSFILSDGRKVLEQLCGFVEIRVAFGANQNIGTR